MVKKKKLEVDAELAGDRHYEGGARQAPDAAAGEVVSEESRSPDEGPAGASAPEDPEAELVAAGEEVIGEILPDPAYVRRLEKRVEELERLLNRPPAPPPELPHAMLLGPPPALPADREAPAAPGQEEALGPAKTRLLPEDEDALSSTPTTAKARVPFGAGHDELKTELVPMQAAGGAMDPDIGTVISPDDAMPDNDEAEDGPEQPDRKTAIASVEGILATEQPVQDQDDPPRKTAIASAEDLLDEELDEDDPNAPDRRTTIASVEDIFEAEEQSGGPMDPNVKTTATRFEDMFDEDDS